MLCKHFGDCGGCFFQDIDYKEQLQLKKELVQKQAVKNGVPLPPFELLPSPEKFFYRNKLELTFFQKDDNSVGLGFHRRGTNREAIDISECLLFSERLPEYISEIKEMVNSTGLPAYNKYSHKGFWRYVVLRKNRQGRFLLGIVTSSQGSSEKIKELLDKFVKDRKARGACHIVSDNLGDAVGYEKVVSLAGVPWIWEEFCGVTFAIGLVGFFQVNPYATEILYQWVKDFVFDNLSLGSRILDLYAGSGGVGLVLSKYGMNVLGVEMDENAIWIAKENLKLNEIKGKYSVLKGNVRAILGINRDWKGRFDCVIIDPPRSGLPPKVRDRTVKLDAEYLVYISCNPVTFMKDVKVFLDRYEFMSFKAIDMFPHTPHLEVVGFLRRKR